MGVRKRYPFTDVHVKTLGALVDKEIDSVIATVKEPVARRRKIAELSALRAVITDIQGDDVEPEEVPPVKAPVSTKPAKPPAKRKTKAERDAEKAAKAVTEPPATNTTGGEPAS